MKPWSVSIVLAAFLLASVSPALGGKTSVESLTKKAVSLASDSLQLAPRMERACLTNALSASFQGKSTRRACDVLTKHLGVSLGKGNLLPLHEKTGEPLWFAMVAKTKAKNLMMVLVEEKDGHMIAGDTVNVYVDKGTSFEPFKKAFKQKAFALVTLANGWADGMPEDLITGSLYHDHLCCGVCSGYVTVRYIRQQYPLSQGEAYTYIGAPAWCQDDYIMSAMNLTPGKHGYVTMAYPWSRPWESGDKLYAQLGGILIRFDRKKEKGSAHLLSYDWHLNDFKTHLNMPDLTIDWKTDPWLHVLYNRFLMKHAEQPSYFVSTIKTLELSGKKDLNRLVNMGANPLAVMLGPDETWIKEITP